MKKATESLNTAYLKYHHDSDYFLLASILNVDSTYLAKKIGILLYLYPEKNSIEQIVLLLHCGDGQENLVTVAIFLFI